MIVKRAEAERRVPSIKRAPKWKKWFLLSADGTKNLGGYRLKREAVQREREVQFFKHRKNNPYREAFDAPERKRRWERRAMRDEPYTTEGAHVLQLGPSSLAMGNIPVTMRDPDDPKKFIAVPMLEEVDPGKPIWDRVGDDLYVKVIDGIHWGVRITEIEPEHEAGPYSYRVEYGPYTRPAWRDVRTLDPVPMPRAYTKTTFDFPVPARDVDILEQINDVIWDELDLEFPRRYNPRRRNPKPFGGREHDWGEVLIQKGSKRRTRKQIRDYYLENAKKIWPYLKNQTVMVILAPKKNEFVLRRKGPDGKYIKLTKLEGIDDPRSFEYWINRRVIEFHPVITGKTTPLVWIDIDPYRTKSKAMNRRMQRRIQAAIPLMKSILRQEFKASPIRVWRSGKQDGGWHVEGNLPRAMDVDRVRLRLRAALDAAFKDDRHFVTTIAKPDQIRLDTTLLKTTGSLRAPYSYTVDGEQKLPANAHENPIMLNPPLAHMELERFKAAATMGPNQVERFKKLYRPDVLGKGVGRTAFLVEGEEGWEVIKVDHGDNPGQTKQEIECLLGQDHPLMLDLIDYDAISFRWIHIPFVDAFNQVRDPADTHRYKKAFYKYSGIKWPKFEKATIDNKILLNSRIKGRLMQDLGINQKSREFLNELFEAMEHCDIMVHEVGIFENWGIDSDGQLKILDMGQ